MGTVNLNQLALQVKLDPKVVRRVIRKQFPSVAGQGKYLFDDTNPLYQEIIEACKEATTPKKGPKKARRERKYEPIVWNDQGYCIVDGQVWGLALVPTPEDPTTRVAQSIYLGKAAEIEPVLKGLKPVPVELDSWQKSVIDKIREAK